MLNDNKTKLINMIDMQACWPHNAEKAMAGKVWFEGKCLIVFFGFDGNPVFSVSVINSNQHFHGVEVSVDEYLNNSCFKNTLSGSSLRLAVKIGRLHHVAKKAFNQDTERLAKIFGCKDKK